MTADAASRNTGVDGPWTVQRILDWTVPHLKKHGSETPRLDAEILLAHARQCERIELYTHFNDVPDDEERAVMRELVKRRANAEPVAYLVGHREFFSLDFAVTPDVLIPRPDTETLVMEALDRVKTHNAPRILDIGTGSGCVAIALAVNQSQARITATDVSSSAIELATQNAAKHGVLDRIQFLLGDLFEPVPVDEPFDLIVSNPPYIAESEMEGLPPDVRCHEPRQALVAGQQGLDVLTRLISESHQYLTDRGHILFEIGETQASAVRELVEHSNEYRETAVLNDLAGKMRVICATKAT